MSINSEEVQGGGGGHPPGQRKKKVGKGWFEFPPRSALPPRAGRGPSPVRTAREFLGRLAEHSPEKFGPPQHTIVQRLLRSLRRNAAEVIIPRMAGGTAPAVIGDPGTASNDATSDRPTVGTISVKRK